MGEGLWGMIGLRIPNYVASSVLGRGIDEGVTTTRPRPPRPWVEEVKEEDDEGQAPYAAGDLDGEAGGGRSGTTQQRRLDDSLTSLLLEDYPLWLLRSLFECIEMAPNGSPFLSSSSDASSRDATWSMLANEGEEEQRRRALVDAQVAEARRDLLVAEERRTDVLALFGSGALHEHNILR